MKTCRLISFDSSTKSTGYSIFINGIFKYKAFIDHGDIKDGQERLAAMMKDICKVIDEQVPDIVTWETPVVPRNPQTQRDLSMLTGAIMGKCVENNIFYYPFRPTEWRKIVSNDGEKLPRKREELKPWGKNKVKDLFGINVENDDESDSILIGQAYVNKFSR
jgi:Holliday junction resolvasome RuvABC endonuclease subunit